MSNVSISSSKFEDASQLMQEIEAVRAMNASLHLYLEHLRSFRKNLGTLNENFKELYKVNNQWVEMLQENRYE